MKNKTLQRALATFMSMLIAFGSVGVGTVISSAADPNNYVIISNSAVADPNTSDIKSQFKLNNAFDSLFDGKILADKTVMYNGDHYGAFADYDDDEFGVELSALAQSYTVQSHSTITTEGAVHPDVVFIVDLSSSMKNNNITDDNNVEVYPTRAEGTVVAMNNAIGQLMAADPKTRIGIVSFANVFDGTGPDDLYLPLDNYTLPEGATDYLLFDKAVGTQQVTVPDALVVVKSKVDGSDTVWFYPETGTKSNEERTDRARVRVAADGSYAVFAADSNTATKTGTIASAVTDNTYANYTAELYDSYVLMRVGNCFYVYDTSRHEDPVVTFSNIPDERQTFTTDGGDTFYAASINGSVISIFADPATTMPFATLTASDTTKQYSVGSCTYTFERISATSFTVKSEGTATIHDAIPVTPITRTTCTFDGKTLYAISENGTINFYEAATGGSPVAAVSSSSATDSYIAGGTTYTITRTSDTAVTVSYLKNMSGTGNQTGNKTGNAKSNVINGVNFKAYVPKNDTKLYISTDGTNYTLFANVNDTHTMTSGGITYTVTRTGDKSFSVSWTESGSDTFTGISRLAKTACPLAEGDTIYAMISAGSMVLYHTENGQAVKTLASGESWTDTINGTQYTFTNDSNNSLSVSYSVELDTTKTVNGFPAKLPCTIGEETFYITAQGADGNKVIKVYDAANAVQPIATTHSVDFTYNSEDYSIIKNSDSSVTIGLICDYSESGHTTTKSIPSVVSDTGTNPRININADMTGTDGNAVGRHTGILDKSGTYTQIGLSAARDMFNAVTDTKDRVPIIVLVSDGEPSQYNTNFTNPPQDSGSAISTNGTGAYYTIRTAMYMKQQVDAHYPDNTVRFFSLGPGVTSLLGKTVLYPNGPADREEGEPSYFEQCETSGVTRCTDLHTQLMNAINNEGISLDYINFADWGLVGDLKAEELVEGFQHVVELVNDIPRPITVAEIDYTETHTHMADGKNMVFVDTIGDGMGLSFINDDGTYTLADAPVLRYCSDDGTKYTASSCTKEAIDDGYVYRLKYNYTVAEASTKLPKDLSTVEVNVYVYANGNQMVEWKIPADLVPAINFNIKNNTYDGTDPVRLIYQVHLTTETTGTYYTNSTTDPATCIFVPATGNPHYYETEYDAQDNVVSNFVYDITGKSKAKSTNTTETKNYAWDVETDTAGDYGVIIQSLGNNGKISIASKNIGPDSVVIDYGIPVKVNVKANDGLSGSVTAIASAIADNTVLNDTAYAASRFGSGKVVPNAASGLALTYGTATLDSNGIVTYSLDTSKSMEMKGTETFYYEFTTTGGDLYYSTVTVIPATSLYYEDSFVTFNPASAWTTAGTLTANAFQHEDRAGDVSANNYGYDGTYKTMETYSLGQARKVTVSASDTNKNGAKYAAFTFTGTAFDVISLTSNTTGTVNCTVTDKNNETVGNWAVDTYYGYEFNEDQAYMNVWQFKDGAWCRIMQAAVEENEIEECGKTVSLPLGENNAEVPILVVKELPAAAASNAGDRRVIYTMNWAANDHGTLYQIPVIKSPTFDYGTYTVKITPAYSRFFDHTGNSSYDFYLDAVRVYNPADPDDDSYDTVSAAYTADRESDPKYLELKDVVTAGKYTDETTTGVLFLDGYTTSDLSQGTGTYSNFGPNNEIYLSRGNSVALRFSDTNSANIASVQLAARIFEDSDKSGKTTTNTDKITATNTKGTVTVNGVSFGVQRKNTGTTGEPVYAFDIFETPTATQALATITATGATSTATKTIGGTEFTFNYVSATQISATYAGTTNFTVAATSDPVAICSASDTDGVSANVNGTDFVFNYVNATTFSATHSVILTTQFTKNTASRSAFNCDGVDFYAERIGNETDGYSFYIYEDNISSTVLPNKNEQYTTATDLYYDITATVNAAGFKNNQSPIIIIANTGIGKISITNLKVTYRASASAANAAPAVANLSPELVKMSIACANNIYVDSITEKTIVAVPEYSSDSTDPQENEPVAPTTETDDGNETGGVLGFFKNLFEKIVSFIVTAYNYIRFNLSLLF